MRGTETDVLGAAERIAEHLARQMRATGITTLDGPRRSNIEQLMVSGSVRGGLSLRWRSNGATVPAAANMTAATALIENADGLLREVKRIHSVLTSGEALGRSLAARMVKCGLNELPAPRRTRFLRLALNGNGELFFTWQSNRATVRLQGNIGGCEDLLANARRWDRELGAAESARAVEARHNRALADHGRDVLRRHGGELG